MARHRIAVRQQWRRQMEFEAGRRLRTAPRASWKAAVGVEPRDFVFVLVGHQLEEVARHRLGEFAWTRAQPWLRRREPARRSRDSARRKPRPGIRSGSRRGERSIRRASRVAVAARLGTAAIAATRARVVRGEPAPGEGLLVASRSRRRSARSPAGSPRSDSGMQPFWNAKPSMNTLVAMLSPISAVAMPRGVDDVEHWRSPTASRQRSLHRVHLEIDVGIEDEIGGGLQVGVDDGAGRAALDARAAPRGWRRPRCRSRAPDRRRRRRCATAWISSGARRDAHMAHHRAALLRQARDVQRRAAASVEMRGHAEQRADGDDAGAADAGDQDVVRLVERAQRRRRQHRRTARPESTVRRLRLRSVPPWTVTKLGQKPLTQEKSLLQVDWSIARLRPNSVSSGSTDRQFDACEQSPQPSQTSSLMNTRFGGSGIQAALAAPALLGGAGLVVDDHGDAGPRAARAAPARARRGAGSSTPGANRASPDICSGSSVTTTIARRLRPRAGA